MNPVKHGATHALRSSATRTSRYFRLLVREVNCLAKGETAPGRANRTRLRAPDARWALTATSVNSTFDRRWSARASRSR
jgi:hypothetical protein